MIYLVRSPELPMIIDTGERLYSFTGDPATDVDLADSSMSEDSSYLAIDSTGESFSYYPGTDTIFPDIIQKNTTKKVVIELYNLRKLEGSVEYVVKSLGNKRYAAIIADIATLLIEEQNR